MKRISFMIVLGIIFGLSVTAYANTFFDNFNHGKANGWWLGTSRGGEYGNWRVEVGSDSIKIVPCRRAYYILRFKRGVSNGSAFTKLTWDA